MYLQKLIIKNFRAIESLTVEFNKGVNVLIGENNSGKSAIIDALRICLGYGKQLREIVIKESDFYFDRTKPSYEKSEIEIEFHLHFKFDDITENAVKEKRYFLELTHQEENSPEQELRLHFRYWLEKSTRKDDRYDVRWEVWGGTYEGQSVPNEPLQLIGYTFLDALRDATQKLRPYSQNNKLASLFENLMEYKDKQENSIPLNKDKKRELAGNLVKWLKDENDEFGNEWKYLIKEAEKNVIEHFKESIIEEEPTKVEIGFSGYEYKDIVNNLQMSIPIFDEENLKKGTQQRYFMLNQNGLGENNLIYAATILGDLINRKEAGHYHALLIEEPEAHLHPQKQNTFFNYLNTLSDKNIQTFITSHSPTITAKSDLNFVIVLQKQNNKVNAVAIKDIDLSTENKNHLRKFLDVTKSQLFFAKGVILVEGISEAILFPVFAKVMDALDKDKYDPIDNNGKEWRPKYNLERKGIEIVNVSGVAFEHFAKLFIPKEDNEACLSSRCAIITDDDSDKNNGEKSDRAKKTETFHCKGNVCVKMADRTFEYELFKASDYNQRLMRRIYKRLHSGTTLKNEGITEDLFNDLYNNRLEKDKANFALELSACLGKHTEILKHKFLIPQYIQDAIKWAVNEKTN